jgi:hypothetical protein
MDKKTNYSVRWTQAYEPIKTGWRKGQTINLFAKSGWRKRQIINEAVAHLHNLQLDMIDEVVDKSDLSQAKELINYIKNKA